VQFDKDRDLNGRQYCVLLAMLYVTCISELMNTYRSESGVRGKLPYSVELRVVCGEVHQSSHDRQQQCHLRKLSPVLDGRHFFVQT
jgi:hypothetical protein